MLWEAYALGGIGHRGMLASSSSSSSGSASSAAAPSKKHKDNAAQAKSLLEITNNQDNSFQIFVKTSSGTKTVDAFSSTTVEDVLNQLAGKLGGNVDHCMRTWYVVYGRKTLDLGLSMEECGITKHATLMLRTRVSGKKPEPKPKLSTRSLQSPRGRRTGSAGPAR